MILSSRRTWLAAAATLPVVLQARNSGAAPGAAIPRLQDPAPGLDVPPIEFQSEDGATRTLKEYLGRGVVLNFWATWCVPCIREMPALAKLRSLVPEDRIAILPLASDRGGAPTVAAYFKDKDIAGLPVLLDPRSAALRAFGGRGIPTTILIDKEGRERGRFEGAADWAAPEAVEAVKALA